MAGFDFVFSSKKGESFLADVLEGSGNISSEFPWRAVWFFLHSQGRMLDAYRWKKIWSHFILENTFISENSKFDDYFRMLKAQCWLQMDGGLARKPFNPPSFAMSRKEQRLLSIFSDNVAFICGDVTQSDIGGNYKKLISGSKIKVLGPKCDSACCDFGGDNFISMRFNYLGSGDAPDVSFYSKQAFVNNKELISLFIRSREVKFAIVNGWNSTRDSNLVRDDVEDFIRAPLPFVAEYHSPLMGVSRLLFDSLSLGAREVYVEGVDFYTRLPYHDESYKTAMRGSQELLKSWGGHDLFFNLSFVKAICGVYRVSGDEFFKSAVEYEMEKYSMVLQENFEKH